MGRFANLVREITPRWLSPRSHIASDASSAAADSSWQEAIDNKMYGADTSDYSHVAQRPVPGAARPAGDKSKTGKTKRRVPKRAE
jgi:hypothetical protein